MDPTEKIKRKENPRENANILSLLSFGYIVSLFKQALRNDLIENNIYEVPECCESKKSGDLLEKEWEKEFKKSSPSMAKLMWNRWGWKYILMGCVDLTWRTIKSILEPTALSSLISYFKPGQKSLTKNDAYYYAALVLFLHIFHCIFLHNYIMWVQGLAIEIKAAFSSLIYRKSLKLTPRALSEISLGNIVTLLTKDVYTFRLSIWIINDIWTGTVQVIIICCLLYYKIGIVSLAGISILLLAIPIQAYLGRVVTKLKLETGAKTDERLQATQETLNYIRIIKMYTWEKYFYEKINVTRRKELAKLLLVFYLKMVIVLIGMIFSKAGFYVLLTAYIYLGYATDTTLIFYILANFKDLKLLLGSTIPNRMGKAGEFLSSVKRISKILNSEELHLKMQKTERTSNPVVEINRATVHIGDKEILKDLSFQITSGLTVVTGKVGSGKSSLLKMLVQDYPLSSGSFVRQGEVAYASQEPWLFPSTIRQNILFGRPFEEKRYHEVLEACALRYDLSFFEKGDETILCDRGCNLSKGQQSRINLARAVYRDCEIYLFDDSLAALDQSVQTYIFNEVIRKYLKNKIVLLVSQSEAHIKQADNVIIMKAGKIKEFGQPDQSIIEEIHKTILTSDEKIPDKSEDINDISEIQKLLDEKEEVASGKHVFCETQKKGSVDFDVYKKYFIYGGGFALAFFNLTLGGVTQASESYSDKLLTKWVDNQQSVLNIENNISFYENSSLSLALQEKETTFKWYTIMIIASAVLDLIKTYLMFDFCRRASVNLHKVIIKNIINAVMLFFDNNYIGNILNRFSQDLANIDEQLPQSLSECYRFIFAAGGIVILIASINITFLLYSAIIFTLLITLRYLYLPAGRSLKRLDASTRSPIIGHLNATLEGLTTIRAYGVSDILKDEFDRYQNVHTSAHYMSACTIRAFGFFMDFLCSTFMVVVVARFVFVDTGTSAGNVGLALTQVMLLGNTLQWGVREWSEFENLMTSVERALEYTDVKTENKNGAVLDSWPTNGAMSFENVSLSYNDKEKVLKNLSFFIEAREKIGVVGRTGAGKSSLISSLFRLYKIEGKILIDGVNIAVLDLDFLRKRLIIIPQDPVLFSGTIRSNLDPFNEYNDEEIWKALDRANLKKIIFDLDQIVSTDMSTGQKQLICLTRAILRKTKIVILDEASANMDKDTENLLNQTIKDNFSDCTMIIVAHRLTSVIDCDKIMVMDKGEIKEFDTPSNLLKNSEGMFYSMATQSGFVYKS